MPMVEPRSFSFQRVVFEDRLHRLELAVRIDKSPPLQINEIGMCYFAALIEGLRLINETAADRPSLAENFDANALVHFTRTKGQQIIDALYPGHLFEKALATPVYQQPPKAEPPSVQLFINVRREKVDQPRCVDCGGPRSIGSAERCRECYTGMPNKPKRTRAFEIAINRAGRAIIKTPRTYRCRWCDWEKKRLGRCENCGRANNTWSAKRAAELEIAS